MSSQATNAFVRPNKRMKLSNPSNGEGASTEDVQRGHKFVLLENLQLREEAKPLLCSNCQTNSFISEQMKTTFDILVRNSDPKKKHANALAFLGRVFAEEDRNRN